MKRFTIVLLSLIFLSTCRVRSSENSEVKEIERLPLTSNLFSLKMVGFQDSKLLNKLNLKNSNWACVPISGLAQMKLSPNPPFSINVNSASKHIETCSKELSVDFSKKGTWLGIYTEFLKKKYPIYSNRFKFKFLELSRPKEKTPRDHLRSVHKAFVKSLEAGIAPIIGLSSEHSFYSQSSKGYRWTTGALRHAIVLLKIEKSLGEEGDSVFVELFDPDRGQVLTGLLATPTKSFFSRKEVEVEVGKEKEGYSKYTSRPNVDGFSSLEFIIPKAAWFAKRPFWQRRVIYLTSAVVSDVDRVK